MKKLFIIIIGIFLIFSTTKGDSIIIPEEAIRFRIIANSNTVQDQTIKNILKTNLEKDIYNYLKTATTLEEAQNILRENIKNLDNTTASFLLNNNVLYSHQLNLGKNYFPAKEYKGVIYEEGEYESLVVTLGNGKGNNWWCVLFPPLCLLEAEEQETDEVEYQFFVKKLLDKFTK